MIKEEWQAEIVARDDLDAMGVISMIANWLYPESVMAADRERQLYAEGGEIIARIAAVADARHEKLSAELREWRTRSSTTGY